MHPQTNGFATGKGTVEKVINTEPLAVHLKQTPDVCTWSLVRGRPTWISEQEGPPWERCNDTIYGGVVGSLKRQVSSECKNWNEGRKNPEHVSKKRTLGSSH